MCVQRKTFWSILHDELPFVRISLRKRGLCDLCFLYKDIVCTAKDENLIEKAEEWRTHLECAEITRYIYWSLLQNARAAAKYLLPLRLENATLSYDYTKQLSVPLFSEQTMEKWFAAKKGYAVNLFGIFWWRTRPQRNAIQVYLWGRDEARVYPSRFDVELFFI